MSPFQRLPLDTVERLEHVRRMLGYLVIAATALACFLLAKMWHSMFAWALGILNVVFYLFFPFGKYLALISGIFVVAAMLRSPPADR